MYSNHRSPENDPLSYRITRLLVQWGMDPGITSEGSYFAVPTDGRNILAQRVTTIDERGESVEAARVFIKPPAGLEDAVDDAGPQELHSAEGILRGTHGYARVFRS